MRTLIFWQWIVSTILLGTFVSLFTLLGGFDKTGDARIATAIVGGLIPALVVSYILNRWAPKRLLSLVAGLGAVCLGILIPLANFISGGIAAQLAVVVGAGAIAAFLTALIVDDIRRGNHYERLPKICWAVWMLLIQVLFTSALVAAVAYNIPTLLLLVILIPAAFFPWVMVLALSKMLRRPNSGH